MSDAKQPEHMRPIPDGGLKDAMPSWLKRPPAWRDLPTAEQRHERSLPEPDASEIDPHPLVDVSDLPQWLQSIAARGDIPVPVPDASVDHAVEVVQAAHKPVPVQPGPEPVQELIPDGDTDAVPDSVGPGFMPEPGDTPADQTVSEATPSLADDKSGPASTPPASGRISMPVWILPVAAFVIIALFITLYALM